MPIAVRQAIASASSPRANRFMKGGSNVSRAPPKPSGPWVPSPAAGTPQPAPPCSQRPSFPSESRRVTRSLAPPPAAISARSPGLRSGALSIVVLSHSSAATRSASGYPTSTRTMGPAPTPELWRTKAGPADIPTHGCGAVAINTASISIESTSTARREDEGVGDEDLAAALRNGEPPRLDLRGDAALDRPIVQGALLRVRLGHRPGRIDGPGRDQLAREVWPGGELRLVAIPDLGPVVVHDLADQLGVDRPHHLGLARSQADLAVLLAAQAALAVAVAGEAAADPVGADPRQAEARPVAAAAPAAQRLEAHARFAARFADLGAGQVAHRVAGALLQGDPEDVALAVAASQGLEQAGLRHQCPVVHLALGARVAARGRLAAGLTFLAHVAGDRLARIPTCLIHLLRVEHSRIVPLGGGCAHHQRTRLDQLRLAGRHLRRRDHGAPELHPGDHENRRDAGDQHALPVGLLASHAGRARHPANPQGEVAVGEHRHRPLRQWHHQAVRIGLAAAAHQQLGPAEDPPLLLEKELQRPGRGDGPAVHVALQHAGALDALEQRLAPRSASRLELLAGLELPDADASVAPEELHLGAFAPEGRGDRRQ